MRTCSPHVLGLPVAGFTPRASSKLGMSSSCASGAGSVPAGMAVSPPGMVHELLAVATADQARTVGIWAILALPGQIFPREVEYLMPPLTRHGSMPRRCQDRPFELA